ncbi:MAG TPA: hypothetical protein VFS31_02255, partial [Chitinophagaceae bacterium]|nr:hypothetical protein [Chitinophagaceae bacterium]
YALLEHFPLQQILSAYQQKYPNVTLDMAVRSLTHFNSIKPTVISYIGPLITKPQIEQRIKEAVAAPAKRFSPRVVRRPLPGQRRDDNDNPNQRRGRKL